MVIAVYRVLPDAAIPVLTLVKIHPDSLLVKIAVTVALIHVVEVVLIAVFLAANRIVQMLVARVVPEIVVKDAVQDATLVRAIVAGDVLQTV